MMGLKSLPCVHDWTAGGRRGHLSAIVTLLFVSHSSHALNLVVMRFSLVWSQSDVCSQ